MLHNIKCLCHLKYFTLHRLADMFIPLQAEPLSIVQWNLTLRSPHHYGHPCPVPNCILLCKLAPCNKVTSPLRSLAQSREVLVRFHCTSLLRLFYFKCSNFDNHFLNQACLVVKVTILYHLNHITVELPFSR